MTKQRNEARENLALLHHGVEVIQGFSRPVSPTRPVLSDYLGSGFSGGVVAAVALLGLTWFRRLFKEYPV